MIKKEKRKPLYITLYDQIAGEIVSGRMRKGAKLTPRRTLSKKLGISQNTVDSAYKMLVDTGYAVSVPRQGYIVVYSKSPTGNTPWENDAPETVVFSPNGIDTSHINRGAYARIVRDIVYNDGADIFSYVEKGGETPLRMAISKYLYSFRGVKCSPEQIIIGAGREYQLQAFAAMMKEHTFITENPCDGRLYNSLSEHGRNVKTLSANTGKFDFEALRHADGDILIIEPDARFPRAAAMNDSERIELLNEWDKYIIEICTDSELCPASYTPLYSLDSCRRVVYLGSFSRSLCPAIRTSYMVLPYELMEKWKGFHTYYYALSSKTEQLVLAEFIEKGHYTRHIKQMKKTYSEKKQYIISHLTETFGSGSEIISNNGGTYLTLKTALCAAELKQRAKSCGVKLLSMNSFNVHKTEHPLENDFLVIGIGDLPLREIKNGLRLIEGCL
ncbi:MAG: PLP-dependent aminotransferase family protein [bacterium]|nr:PLP-dependent aminotransferase family protein [bacterium]